MSQSNVNGRDPELHGPGGLDLRPGAQAGLPRGSRDLMPAAFRRRRALTRALVDVFERWGYGPVMTPLVEYYDVLGRGLTEADRRQCVRFIEAGSGDLVALRSDITPQIARMVADRVGGELDGALVRRYCYAADVVRQSPSRLASPATGDHEQIEFHQAGVELIGDADPAADAELIALCDEAVRATGLEEFRIDLAHARIGHELIASLALPDEAAERLRVLLARKDRGGVQELLRRHHDRGPLAEAAVALCDLFGPVGSTTPGIAVLERARAELAGCGLDEGLERLEAVLAHVRALDDAIVSRITVDLGEVRGFEYYTGIRLRVWARGAGRPIARGGRYDDLLGRYGYAAPATGFAIDLDALEAALQASGRAHDAAATLQVHLVAVAPERSEASRVEASRIARAARVAGQRAWVVTVSSPEHARAQADAAGAEALTLVREETVEQYGRTVRGWHRLEQAEGAPNDRNEDSDGSPVASRQDNRERK